MNLLELPRDVLELIGAHLGNSDRFNGFGVVCTLCNRLAYSFAFRALDLRRNGPLPDFNDHLISSIQSFKVQADRAVPKGSFNIVEEVKNVIFWGLEGSTFLERVDHRRIASLILERADLETISVYADVFPNLEELIIENLFTEVNLNSYLRFHRKKYTLNDRIGSLLEFSKLRKLVVKYHGFYLQLPKRIVELEIHLGLTVQEHADYPEVPQVVANEIETLSELRILRSDTFLPLSDRINVSSLSASIQHNFDIKVLDSMKVGSKSLMSLTLDSSKSTLTQLPMFPNLSIFPNLRNLTLTNVKFDFSKCELPMSLRKLHLENCLDQNHAIALHHFKDCLNLEKVSICRTYMYRMVRIDTSAVIVQFEKLRSLSLGAHVGSFFGSFGENWLESILARLERLELSSKELSNGEIILLFQSLSSTLLRTLKFTSLNWSNDVTESLARLISLKKLELSFYAFDVSGDSLTLGIGSLTNLIHLSITCLPYTGLREYDQLTVTLESLKETFRKLRDLQFLSLCFGSGLKISVSDLRPVLPANCHIVVKDRGVVSFWL